MASTIAFTVNNQLIKTQRQGRTRLTLKEYEQTFHELVGKGYRLNYVSGYSVKNEGLLATLWEKRPSPPWVAKVAMSTSEYQAALETFANEGFGLVLVNGYTINGSVKYVAIWDKSTNSAAKHGMTLREYETLVDSLLERGYRLLHVSGYAVGDEARYAAIWEARNHNIEWVAHHNMNSGDFENQHITLTGNGFRLVDVSGYEVAKVACYAGIWERSTAPKTIARHGLTFEQYQGEHVNTSYQGYVPTVVSGCSFDDVDKYSAIWENHVMSVLDLSLIDNEIEDYMNANAIRGLSIAIVKDKRLVFAKGFGFADEAARVKVNPEHLFRIASISKLFTSIAIMKLAEERRLHITDKVFGSGAILGTVYESTHSHHRVHEMTVQNLLEHTSGWAGADIEPIDELENMDQDEMIAWVLEHKEPANPPGVSYDYLNFGYLVLGRVIEKVTGQTYESYVQEITSGFHISRIQIGRDKSIRIPDEVIYYPTADSYNYNISRFDSFGGWVATAMDVVKIMVGIDLDSNGTGILKPATVKEMFTPSSANLDYAKGWIVKSDYRGHNGALNGSGSFYVQKAEGGFSFAVLCNSRPSDDLFCYGLRDIVDGVCTRVSNWPEFEYDILS